MEWERYCNERKTRSDEKKCGKKFEMVVFATME